MFRGDCIPRQWKGYSYEQQLGGCYGRHSPELISVLLTHPELHANT